MSRQVFVKKSKNPKYEFSLHTKLYSMFPNFITRPVKLKKKYIILKMYKNKSLKHFISRHPGKLNIPSIINKVKRMIKTIQLKVPLFRHNDLHTGNIIVDGNKLRLTDFELSRLAGKTPKYIKEYGITSKHNPHYDIHCFLNSLRRVKKYTKVVDKFLPSGYRGKTDKYVRNYRLLF